MNSPPNLSTPHPYLVALNLTRRCNLACSHCYLDATTRLESDAGEMDTETVCSLLDDMAQAGVEMVVLTGGEPFLRKDITRLAQHGSRAGLMVVVGTNGMMLTQSRVAELKEAGVAGVGISLDSLDPSRHDAFRGQQGCWEAALAGMDWCREAGLPFQIHYSVVQENAHEIDEMISFAEEVGARVLNVFFLVCTGRGESFSDINPANYEQVLLKVAEAAKNKSTLMVRARCAPHFKRMAYQADPNSPLTRMAGYDGGGCPAGKRYCRITPEGQVTPCPYMPLEAGNLSQQWFAEIWQNAPLFKQLRTGTLGGVCGRCEYRLLCGGCRARPVAHGGGVMDEDPWCGHVPGNGPLIRPESGGDTKTGQNTQVAWHADARQRLANMPAFVRRMVERRAEAYAMEQGKPQVTLEILETLRAQSPMAGMARPGSLKITPTKMAKTEEETGDTSPIPWTKTAKMRLSTIPDFLRGVYQQIAQETAKAGGHLEINVDLLDRLEDQENFKRRLPWHLEAEETLQQAVEARGGPAGLFIQGVWEEAAERLVFLAKRQQVNRTDVLSILSTDTAGVVWRPDAWHRLQNAPAFIRSGIKKAAEYAARREGLAEICPDDLTRFRNRAMLRAVKRLRGFGMQELSFSGFDEAKKRVKRLRNNPQAEQRMAAIQSHVEGKGGALGVLDQSLMTKMREMLEKPNA